MEREGEATDFGPVPPELLALWVKAAATMDADVLDASITRLRRTWSARALVPLERAVAARRRVLAGAITKRRGT